MGKRGSGTILITFVTALLALAAAAGTAHAARRALVIGNSSYASAPQLPNPANDARDLAQRLEGLGYRVTLLLDAQRGAFLKGYQAFIASLQPDDLALLYYAGHGLQIGGENYLFPVDAAVDSETDAKTRLVPLNALLADLSRATKTRIVILDACRNNPFGDKLAQSEATRSAGLTRGLARVYAGVGSFIAYSTQPGNVALDGRGRNSPFTEALLRHMAAPGADVHAVLRRVRADVQQATAEQQVPWENSSLIDEVAFAADAASPAVNPPPKASAASPRPAPEPPRSGPPARSFAYVSGLDPKGDNFLALRTKPTGDGGRIATLGPDTLLDVLETQGDWRRVSLLDGTIGWAHGNWIKCCRTVAVARPAGLSPAAPPRPAPPAAAAADSCDALWHQRNAVWHRHGYCFTSAKGQQVFGNQGCTRNEAAARAAMSPAERAEIEALAEREKRLGCR